MRNLTNFTIVLLLALIVVVGTSFATSPNASTNTIISANSISSALTSNALNVSTSTANQVNVSVTIGTFDKVISPISGYIDSLVLILFVIIVIYGVMIIYSKDFDPDITSERRLRMVLEYAIGAGLVLLLIPYIYVYVHYFPQIIETTAPQIMSLHSMVPVYIIWIDLFISVLISLVGFLLAMREYVKFIKTYQTSGTGNSGSTDAERAQALQRVFAITAFMFLSPFILGILFITLTQVFFATSVNISSALISSTSTANAFRFPFYQTSLYPHCPTGLLGGFNVVGTADCTIYGVLSSVYGVGFEATIFNTMASIMTSTWGDLPAFMLIYDLGVLLLMVYSFAKIDWYSLQYMASLKTGELEARNYNKLKSSYIQYIAFLLSPIIFIIAILALNSLVTVMLSIISSSQLSVVPPLVNLVGTPTAENILLSISGDVMSIFGLLLLLVVIVMSLLKVLGGIIFAVAIFLYFSEDAKYKMFGKNLLIFFIILYMIPVIILLVYSLFFGLLPSLISQSLGYGTSTAVSTTLGSYSSTVVSSTEINIVGPNITVKNISCVSRSSMNNTIAVLKSQSDSGDALGVLLGSCQGFVGYWSNGYDIIAILAIVAVIVAIIGLPTIVGSLGAITGLGSGGVSGAVSLTKGIQGKPLMEKLSTIQKNMSKNRSNFKKKMDKKAKKSGASLGKYLTGRTINRVKENAMRFGSKIGSNVSRGANAGESTAYALVTAPISGTALGSALDRTRSGAKKIVSDTIERTKNDIKDNQKYYISKGAIEKYAKNHKNAGETDKQAIGRFEKTLKERYGAEVDKDGNFRLTNRNLRELNKFTHYNFESPKKNFINKNIDEVENDRDSDIRDINDEYNEKIQTAKKKGNKKKVAQLEKEKDEKLSDVENFYSKKLDSVSKRENFKDYASYTKLRETANDVDAISNPNGYVEDRVMKAKERAKSEILLDAKESGVELTPQQLTRRVNESIDEAEIRKKAMDEVERKKTNFVDMLKEHGLKVDPLTGKSSDLESILKNDPSDLQSISYLAFDTLGTTKDHGKALDMMVKAISERKPNMNYTIKATLGNLGKEIGIEYLNPMVGAIRKRYDDTVSIIGKMKDYAFVSGIPVYAQYDNEIKSYETKINDLLSEGGDLRSIIEDSESSPQAKKDAEIKIGEIYKKLEELETDKKRLEAKKDSIDHLTPVLKSALQGKLIPSFSSYVKMVSSDDASAEIGRIEIKKKMLENERRIIDKNIKAYKADLELAKDNANRKDLTDYQKLQFEKMINDLKYKISNLDENKKVFDATIEDINKTMSSANNIKSSQKLANSLYTESTIEGNIYDGFRDATERDNTLSKIAKQREQIKMLEAKQEIPDTIKDYVKSISERISDHASSDRINMLDIDSLMFDKNQERSIQELNDPNLENYKNRIKASTSALSYIKDGNLSDAEKTIVDTFGSENKAFAKIRNDIINNLSDSLEKIKSKSSTESEKASYDDLLEKITQNINKNKIHNKEEAKSIIDEAIKKSELKDVLAPTKAEYGQLTDFSKVEKSYKDNLIEALNEYIQTDTKELGDELDIVSKDINLALKKSKNEATNLATTFGSDNIELVEIGRYLTMKTFKDIITKTEKTKFDYEALKKRIKDSLTVESLKYGLTEDDIEKISSFDIGVLSDKNVGLSKKYIKSLQDIIIPELKKTDHNSVAKIISRAIDAIKDNNYTDRQKDLNSLAITTLTSDLARNMSKFESSITGKKKTKSGVGMRKALFRRGAIAFRSEVHTHIQPNGDNAEVEDSDKEEKEEKEEDDDKEGRFVLRRIEDDRDDDDSKEKSSDSEKDDYFSDDKE